MSEIRGSAGPCFLWRLLLLCTEKAVAPHSSTLTWRIPWTEEPSLLQSMGSLRVGHDLVTSLSLFTFMHWRRQWQPTPVFLPGESQGRGSLVGCHLWGRTMGLHRVGHDWSNAAAAAVETVAICYWKILDFLEEKYKMLVFFYFFHL